MTAREQMVRELDRTGRRDLVAMAKAVAPSRGNRWLLGGPDAWSKDELISYLVKEAA